MEHKIAVNLSKIIGVIGGMGPFAGLDFVQKIFINTKASKDQEHINCLLISCPAIVPDRTTFLIENNVENPAYGMFECARRLFQAGASQVIVACNAAHADRIFSLYSKMVKENLPDIEIVNMLKICADYSKKFKRIGLLGTIGTHNSRVYHDYFDEKNFILLEPDQKGQENVNNAIANENYGIKAHSFDIKPQAIDLVSREIEKLVDLGAEAVILGCTELPLAVKGDNFTVPLIDPGLIAARKLIEMIAPEKLLEEKQ